MAEKLKNLPTQVAVRAILLSGNRVLLVKRAKGGFAEDKWCLPGGRLNPEEKIVDGIKREIMEEVSIDFEPRYVYKSENPDTSTGVRWLTHYFTGYVPDDYIGLGLDETENQAVGFFSEEELGLLDIAFDHRQVLEDFFGGR